MVVQMRQRSIHDRILDADVLSSRWLADGNEAKERGDKARAEKYYEKSQFWLDRFNLLSGKGERPAPKR